MIVATLQEAAVPLTAVAIVTGACGGMGEACARRLGQRWRLVLTDLHAQPLEALAVRLRAEGLDVAAAVAGDLSDVDIVEKVLGAARAAGPLRALAHTAGLSPALAGWEAILRTNYLASELLLRNLETDLPRGFAAVLVASIAGHVANPDPAVDACLHDHNSEGLLAAVERLGRGADDHARARIAYQQSKRAVIALCEDRAVAWAALGARIVSVSPGMIATPMGRKEVETNPHAAATLRATPLGGWGAPDDIASAADFLLSDEARFITGCDLRVDGGVIPSLRASLPVGFSPAPL